MEAMTSLERMLKTLERKPVDRVPSFEWIIDKKVVQALMPGATEEDFICEVGRDILFPLTDQSIMQRN